MGHKTDIEWADATWNPTRGCSRLSEGCRNCYAEAMAGRFSKPGQPYAGVAKMTKAGARWTGKVKFFEHLLCRPLIWQQPLTIFVDSMSDLFHEGVPQDVIDQVVAVMAIAERHTFMVLTRRVLRMRVYFADPEMPARVRRWILTPPAGSALAEFKDGDACVRAAIRIGEGPLSNVWLGCSVEDQPTANERVPQILSTPAAIRFISYEPAIGPVNFARIERRPSDFDKLMPGFETVTALTLNALDGYHAIEYPGSGGLVNVAQSGNRLGPKLDWIICGGESGTGARVMHPDWARLVRDQCVAFRVPFFFKQWGAWRPEHDFSEAPTRDREVKLMPDGVYMHRVGKKAAGRLLDGKTWLQMPALRQQAAA